MCRSGFLTLWIALIVPCWVGSASSLAAQRHGRPDSVQNYYKAIPEPTLTITIRGQSTTWTREAFAAMTQASATVPRGRRASSRQFTGVPLAELLPPNALLLQADVYEIHHGFFHTRRLKVSDLQPGTDLLIADWMDQRKIARTSLFYVIATTRDGKAITIGKVTSIVVGVAQG